MRRDIDEDVRAAFEALSRDGVVRPVALGSSEEQLFADCDLASLAENRLGERRDPRGLDAQTRARWKDTATDEDSRLPGERSYERCFWLVHEGEIAGTVSALDSTWGSARAYLASVYLMPHLRGRGVGASSMRAIRDALFAREVGVRLDTSWLWQPAVRFYLQLGMWCWSWKRTLSFRWDPGVPPPLVEVDGARASFSLERAGVRHRLLDASHDGTFLTLTERHVDDDAVRRLAHDAQTAFVAHLASRGWPLVRGPAEFERYRGSDLFHPEALADRLEVWEAYAADRGWRVETPRIPWLRYPSWESLQDAWKQR